MKHFKMAKKLLSALIAMVMVMSLFSGLTFADDETDDNGIVASGQTYASVPYSFYAETSDGAAASDKVTLEFVNYIDGNVYFNAEAAEGYEITDIVADGGTVAENSGVYDALSDYEYMLVSDGSGYEMTVTFIVGYSITGLDDITIAAGETYQLSPAYAAAEDEDADDTSASGDSSLFEAYIEYLAAFAIDNGYTPETDDTDDSNTMLADIYALTEDTYEDSAVYEALTALGAVTYEEFTAAYVSEDDTDEEETVAGFVYETADESVATVTEDGLVTGIAAGETTITVTYYISGTAAASETITVTVVDDSDSAEDDEDFDFTIIPEDGPTEDTDSEDTEELLSGLNYDSETGVWAYYTDGEIDDSYTGLATNSAGTWYVEEGIVDFSYTGLVEYDGVLYYVSYSKVSTNTGLYKISGTWYYFVEGAVASDFTGIVSNSAGSWYVEDGIVDFGYTGLVEYDGVLYYVSSSKVSTNTGLYKFNGTWYYFVEGAVDYTYTGLVKNSAGWWYVEDSIVDFDYTGLVEYNGSYWYVYDSNVKFVTGLYKIDGTWYYISNGAAALSYTGLATNSAGTWYVEDGIVDFGYTGTVTIDGVEYTVVNSKVVS